MPLSPPKPTGPAYTVDSSSAAATLAQFRAKMADLYRAESIRAPNTSADTSADSDNNAAADPDPALAHLLASTPALATAAALRGPIIGALAIARTREALADAADALRGATRMAATAVDQLEAGPGEQAAAAAAMLDHWKEVDRQVGFWVSAARYARAKAEQGGR